MDLTVWCVLNGTKYADSDVHMLKSMVARHLDRPHTFMCLSDREIPGIDTLISPLNWPGWWSKLLLFRVSCGQNLYFDLDVVITGPLDDLISEQISMASNWAQSGHGGCQSSVMSWGRDYSYIPDSFDVDQLHEPERGNCGSYGDKKLWGDQEFVTELMGDPGDRVKPMRGIKSYKYHCRQGLPDDARVVCFHGNPKPNQVSDEWVLNARSFTATAA
ncbi:MAG: hypothetical protein DRH08_03015 [Deltaproteobacteria bacterium]|nr:MAG: hypothetical protein DRH08_03015 [Deltaproteobacteria bacterium]